MTDYYLMPTKWSREGHGGSAIDHTDWIRLVNCSHQKKQQVAEKYEKELNNGELFSMEIVVKERKTLFSVLAIPYCQARDYNSFSKWPCNKDQIDFNGHLPLKKDSNAAGGKQ